MTMRHLACFFALACLPAGQAARAVDFLNIAGVTSATDSTDYFGVLGLIEGPGIGFDSNPPFARLSDTTWVTNAPNGYPASYFGPTPSPAAKLVFDLGSDVPVSEISIWGYATGIEGNSMKEFSLRFATDGEGPGGAGTSIAFNPTFTAGPKISPRQSFLFGQQVTARYVELVPLSNNVEFGPGGDRVGFGEVAFEAIPTVTGSFADLPSAYAIGITSFETSFSLIVRNLGPQPLTLENPSFTGAAASAYTVVEVPEKLAPWSVAEIKLKYDPLNLPPGDASVTFKVNTNTDTLPVAETIITAEVPLVKASRFYPIVSAVSATDATDYYKVSGLINGAGTGFLKEPPYTQIINGGGSLWVTNNPNGGGGYYAPAPDITPLLTLDLGADVPLSEISIWGYSVTNSNGMRDFTLSFATSDEGPAGAGNRITYQPTFTAQFGETVRDSFPFTETVTARYVLLRPLNNWGTEGVAPGGDRVGIGEVAFEMPAQVVPPAPAEFHITAASRDAQGHFQLTFETVPSYLFTVYRSTDLTNWTALPDPVTGTTTSATYTDVTPLPAGKVFYEVRRSPL